MALTNAEKQARWREKHIGRRRDADRVATLLVRTNWPDGHVEEIAGALRAFFNTEAEIAALRRALKPMTEKETNAMFAESSRQDRAAWRKAHPGKRVTNKAVHEWRVQRNRAETEAADKARIEDWERDHPGQKYDEHFPTRNQRELTDYYRWERQRERKLARP
jgi:hypothetical protein